MKGTDILRELRGRDVTRDSFIRWWRRENDFADVELLTDFMRAEIADLDFGGYELLGMEQMWDLLRQHAGDQVDLSQKGGEKLLLWRRADGETVSMPFTPEALMEVFDAETRGDLLM